MNNKQFKIFIGIMNKLEQPTENDIDQSANILYDELCPVPSKQVHLVFPKSNEEKESKSLVTKSEFYETFRHLAAEYSKEWINHQLKENSQKKLQTSASKFEDTFQADKLFQDSISSTYSGKDTIKLPVEDTTLTENDVAPQTNTNFPSAEDTSLTEFTVSTPANTNIPSVEDTSLTDFNVAPQTNTNVPSYETESKTHSDSITNNPPTVKASEKSSLNENQEYDYPQTQDDVEIATLISTDNDHLSLKNEHKENIESPTNNDMSLAENEISHIADDDHDTSLTLETEIHKKEIHQSTPAIQNSAKKVTFEKKSQQNIPSVDDQPRQAKKRRLPEDEKLSEENGPTDNKQSRLGDNPERIVLKSKKRRSRTKSKHMEKERKLSCNKEIIPPVVQPNAITQTMEETTSESLNLLSDTPDTKAFIDVSNNQEKLYQQNQNTPIPNEDLAAVLTPTENVKKQTKDIASETSISLSHAEIQTDLMNKTLTNTDVIDNKIKSIVQATLDSCKLPTKYQNELDRIQTIEQTLLATAHQLEQNQPFLKDLQEQRVNIVRNQEMLQDILSNLQEVLKLNQSLFNLNLTNNQNADPQQNILEIQKLQMEHDLKLKQIQSAIDIEEIKAKSQAYNVKSQHEIGVGKLELEKWKTELQNAMNAETLFKNQEHQFRVMKVQSEIDSERQRQKDMQTHLDNERDRFFQKEMQEHKFQHATRLDEIDKQFRQLQQMQKEAHESKINERDVVFKTNLQNLKHDHEAFIEINKQKFNKELEERKISSNEALTEHKLLMEKYKADLLADIKWQQVRTQDENEKMKIQLKMAELELKLNDSNQKASSNKFFFRQHPQQTSSFEHQMESSAEIAPHSQVKAFERLWNLQYETGMQSSRILKLKKELISAGKKCIENVAVFNSYMSEDLTDWVITRRLDFCEKFNRQGMFLFKTGANFNFSKHRITRVHLDVIQQSSKSSSDYISPRYKVSENGRYIIDTLEFMNTWLLFPINVNYQIDLTRTNDIAFGEYSYNCIEVIDEVFHGRQHKSVLKTGDKVTQPISKPKRSTPIYVSDIPMYNLRNKPAKQTRTQIFV